MRKVRAKLRRERTHPQVARVFSTNFLEQMVESDVNCFVPLQDYKKLEHKYLCMFKRFKRKA